MTNKTFTAPLSIKDVDESGEFTGYASVYGNTDLQGDRVVPGAFDRSLSDTGGRVLVLCPARSGVSDRNRARVRRRARSARPRQAGS